MEAAHDNPAAQQWQPDPDTSLVLSDVHIGCGVRSDTADVQTTILTFSRSNAELTCLRERAKVLTGPASQRCVSGPIGTARDRAADSCNCSEKAVSAYDEHREHPSMDMCNIVADCDADGDLILPRRPQVAENPALSLIIRHRMATPLRNVGLQVWRGSLLLAEYVLARAADFAGVTGCELGAGSGVAGIALACAGASCVFITDVGESVLGMCQANVDANRFFFPCGPATAAVRWLDWREPPPAAIGRAPAQAQQGSAVASRYVWQQRELHDLQHAQVILAADTVYDDQLTEAMMRCASLLLRPCKTCSGAAAASPGRKLLLALEKRYNFTLRDLDTRASAYDHWRSLFTAMDAEEGSPSSAAKSNSSASLRGRQIPLREVPRLLEYDRGTDLELWELSRGWPP